MASIFDLLGNYIGEGSDPSNSAGSPPVSGSLNLYQPIAPNAPPPSAPAPQMVVGSYQPPVPRNPSMGMSFNGTGALDMAALAPPAPGALSPQSAVADQSWILAAEQPEQPKDGLFSFMNSPGATDSMVAFGSAMLRAPDFNTGLADAAEAVNKVAQKYRPISQVEINNLRQRAMIEGMMRQIANPQRQDAPPTVSVNDNRPVYGNLPGGPREMFYPTTQPDGSFGFTQASTGQFFGSIENALRPEDDAAKYNSKNVAAARDAALTEAISASANASRFESMAANFDAAGGGAGYADALKRYSADALGMDILGVNVAKKNEVDKFLRDLELGQAQTQRGLGQLTEAERAIIRESLPSIKDDPRAFKKIMYTMAAQSNRAAMLYDRWINSDSLQAQYEDPRQYYRAWLRSDEGKSYEMAVRQDIEAKLSTSSPEPGTNPELEDALKRY